MKITKSFRSALLLFAIITGITGFYSCKKTSTYQGPAGTAFNNGAMTQASISGQIIDENGAPLEGVTVEVGTHKFITDKDGIFYFSKISTPQNATLITATKSYYMNGYRTLSITPNKDQYTKIMLIELKNASTFNAMSGGSINVNGGGSITFPASGIVNKNTGTPYNGVVTVYSKWLDPSNEAVNKLMPGDLRGLNTEDVEKVLQTYGMMAVELFDQSNNPLQIASGKTAQLSFPIPASMSSNAPATIPLWYFDAATGMWREEGSATKQGNSYVGDVKHFSFWNCDYPFPAVHLDLVLNDNTGNPLGNMEVKITNTATGGIAYGFTNGLGFVGGIVPANATLTLEVILEPCGVVLASQTVNTLTSNLSLGTIVVNVPSSNVATITATVLDCAGQPVTNGYVSIVTPTSSAIIPTNSSGSINTTIAACTFPMSATVTAYNLSTMVHDQITTSIGSGLNNLGNLNACSTLSQFVNWTSTIGGTPTSFSIVEPTGYFTSDYNTTPLTNVGAYDSIIGSTAHCYFTFDGLDNVSSSHTLQAYSDHLDNNSTPVPGTAVNMTMYQPMGGYVEGNFNGAITGSTIPTRTVSCSFRVKRN